MFSRGELFEEYIRAMRSNHKNELVSTPDAFLMLHGLEETTKFFLVLLLNDLATKSRTEFED